MKARWIFFASLFFASPAFAGFSFHNLVGLLEQGRISEAREVAAAVPSSDENLQKFSEALIAFYSHDVPSAASLMEQAKPRKEYQAYFDEFRNLVTETHKRTAEFETLRRGQLTLRFAKGKDQVLPLYAIDVLARAVQEIGSDLGWKANQEIWVEFFPAWEDFMAVSTLTEKEVRTSGTIALCKFNKMMLTTPRAMVYGYDWLDTLTHEYVHFALSRASKGNAPVWVHEGIAKFLEKRWRKDHGGELDASSWALLHRRMRAKKLIPFEALHPSIAKLPSQEDAQLAFAQVATFIEYLVNERGGMSNLQKAIAAISTGEDARRAFAVTYDVSFENLSHGWEGWIASKAVPEAKEDWSVRTKLRNSGAKGEVPEEPGLDMITDMQAREWVTIGDLLRERGRPKAALKEYEKAAERKPGPSVILRNRISLVALALGDRDRALSELSKAAETAPSYSATFVRRGAIYLDLKNWDSAEADFLRANAVNPFDPQIHEGLLRVYEAKGDAPNAKRERDALNLLKAG